MKDGGVTAVHVAFDAGKSLERSGRIGRGGGLRHAGEAVVAKMSRVSG